MNILIAIVATITGLIVLLLAPTNEQLGGVTELNNDTNLNNKVTQVLDLIEPVQDAYFAQHGNYWQGLILHSSIPTRASEKVPDFLTRKPHDVEESWQDLFGSSVNIAMPFSVRIDVSQKGKEYGYKVTFITNDAGQEYAQGVGYGLAKSHAWKIFTE